MLKYRDTELEALDRLRRSLPQLHLHGLLTGLRQVGKTAVAREYLERAQTDGASTVFVQAPHITSPAILFRAVYEGLVDAAAGTRVASTTLSAVSAAVGMTASSSLLALLPLYEQTWQGGADPPALVRNAWQLPERVGHDRDVSVVIAVDEVHEIFHQFARTAPFKGGGGLVKSAWDARGHLQHNTRALWIFTTSIRSAVNQFFRADGSPFYLQTREIPVEPLAADDARALAADLADPLNAPTLDALNAIAELSGGLPGILIQLLSDIPPGADKQHVEQAITNSLRGGRLAALYADVTLGLSKSERHGEQLLLHALHAVARGNATTATLARKLAIKETYAANILASLERLELVQRQGRLRRFRYPMMREWLLAQPIPPLGSAANDQELRTQLGFGFEARVRELFSLITSPFTIMDTAEGEYLLRPNTRLILGGFQSVQRHPGPPEIDLIGRQTDGRTLVASMKYRGQHTGGEHIRALIDEQLPAATPAYSDVYPMFISASPFTQGAIEEARRLSVTLLTLAGLNVVARAFSQQPFTAP